MKKRGRMGTCVRWGGCLALLVGCRGAFGDCPEAPTYYGPDPVFSRADCGARYVVRCAGAGVGRGAVIVRREGVVAWVEPEAPTIAPAAETNREAAEPETDGSLATDAVPSPAE